MWKLPLLRGARVHETASHTAFRKRLAIGVLSLTAVIVVLVGISVRSVSHGTGLGSSISHGIIADHGGKLTINSVEGDFTEVIIDLPARVEHER